MFFLLPFSCFCSPVASQMAHSALLNLAHCSMFYMKPCTSRLTCKVTSLHVVGPDISSAGWNVRFYNATGRSENVVDPLYISPEGRVFRSRLAVIRHHLGSVATDKDAIKSFRLRLKVVCVSLLFFSSKRDISRILWIVPLQDTFAILRLTEVWRRLYAETEVFYDVFYVSIRQNPWIHLITHVCFII